MISGVTVEAIDFLNFRIRWTSDQTTPMPIRVFRDGVLVSTWSNPTATGEFDLLVPAGADPFVEILDRADERPSHAAPGQVTLHWQAVSGAVQYRIEEFLAGNWVERALVPDDGSGAFAWQTRWLADGGSYDFRITPLDAIGNAGTPATRTVVQVRHPPTPDVSFAYDDGTGTVSLS